MRYLGLDIGEVRTGVAVSDPSGTVATPLVVLDSRALSRDPKPLLDLVEKYEAGAVVIGLPLTLAGDEGPQAATVRSAGEALAAVLGVPVTWWDERLTSMEAARVMTASGVSEKARRGSVDMVAAAVMLQDYLDASRAGPGGGRR